MLTEATVLNSFNKLVSRPDLDDAVLDKAEELLEELRPESPLRHRLSEQIDELRKRGDKSEPVKKAPAKKKPKAVKK